MEAHNKVRAMVDPPVVDMPKMVSCIEKVFYPIQEIRTKCISAVNSWNMYKSETKFEYYRISYSALFALRLNGL